MFSICHVTTVSKCHVTLWVGSSILGGHPAKFGVHRPYGTGDNEVCNISSNSNSNSNAEVPMPRFTNGRIEHRNSARIYINVNQLIHSHKKWLISLIPRAISEKCVFL